MVEPLNNGSTPLELLGLKEGASGEEITRAWRRLASEHHPDRGGDAATFQTIRAAYRQALSDYTAPVRCRACQGTGKVLRAQGFHAVSMPCSVCGGVGKLTKDR